jgi:hypothetical protein
LFTDVVVDEVVFVVVVDKVAFVSSEDATTMIPFPFIASVAGSSLE